MTNDTSGSTRIDLLRHGEHVLGEAICGVTDPELSARGWRQLDDQCRRLKEQGGEWDICVSSPRKRCAVFAEHLCAQLGIDLLINDGFSEVDFGRWEGLTAGEINASYPGQWQEWMAQIDRSAPHGGESYPGFIERINRSWLDLVASCRGKRVLLLSHGGVMRAILAQVLDLSPQALLRFSVPHACHSRVLAYHMEHETDWFQLDSHNSASAQ